VLLAAAILAVDQLTKFVAESTLAGRAPVPLLGEFLQLRLVYNPGAAFSIGTDLTWFFTVFAAAAAIGLGWLVSRVRSPGWAVALGLMLGGATTHLLDRLFRAPGFAVGHVVDFIEYNGMFVGNIADIALAVGGVLVVVLTMCNVSMDGRTATPAPEA
jgi:signal peptidase II